MKSLAGKIYTDPGNYKNVNLEQEHRLNEIKTNHRLHFLEEKLTSLMQMMAGQMNYKTQDQEQYYQYQHEQENPSQGFTTNQMNGSSPPIHNQHLYSQRQIIQQE